MLSFEQLIINDSCRKQLNAYLVSPKHALMLTGCNGVGLGTIAEALARKLAESNVIVLKPTIHKKQKTNIINVDDIADLASIVRGRRMNKLAIVIDGADQTADGVFERMLKLVEEPVEGVYYIFTAHSLSNIPTTILSRSNVIRIIPPLLQSCNCLYANMDNIAAKQLKFIANGLPALICRLKNDTDSFNACANSVTSAKKFIQGNMNNRIALVSLIADRRDALELCQYIARLLKLVASSGSYDKARFNRQLSLISATADRINNNGNVKLQLLNLAVRLS